MTTSWTCPKCGHPAMVMTVSVGNERPLGQSVWDGVRRFVPLRCSYTVCEYRDAFPPDDPPIADD